MIVTNYHMHNVLNVYSRQRSQNGPAERGAAKSKRTQADSVTISAEGKRKAIIEKVTADIVRKLTGNGSGDQAPVESNPNESAANQPSGENTFVYNVLDAINRKTTNRWEVEDPSLLLKRFEQLANGNGQKKDIA